MTTVAETLLWCDIETTGLDPKRGQILEIAAQPTTFEADFTTIGKPFHILIKPVDVELQHLHPAVREMHTSTLLWQEAGEVGLGLFEATALFRAACVGWGLCDGRAVYLAGRSVHFDRSWLDRANAFDGIPLSHRLFDLTPIKAFANLCGVTFAVPEDAHRALADVEADIALARSMVNAFGGSA